MSNKLEMNKKIFVPRITQLDANDFDKEVHNVLVSQLTEVGKYLKPGALNCIKLEINLIIDLLVFYYSVINKNATFGQELLRLKYKDLLSKNQLVVYALINCILPYLNNKYENNVDKIQSTTIRNLLKKGEIFIKICNFLNQVFFLREGMYPTIADRLLKLKYSPVNKINPNVGYNYMIRELLWHGFMELIIYVVPLINYKFIKRKMRKLFFCKLPESKCLKKIIFDSETRCIICDDFPNFPCQISIYCPHLACYYCIKSNLLADEKFMCPHCGETNTINNNLTFLTGGISQLQTVH